MEVIRIPDRYREGFRQLLAADTKAINCLLSALKEASPMFSLEDIASEASSSCGIPSKDVTEIIKAIVSLYSLRDYGSWSTDEVAEQVEQGIRNDQELSTLSSQDLDLLSERIVSFFESQDVLEIIYKASSLLLEYENVFSNSRIITDMRPIFKSSVEEGMGGALIVHTLKIEYRTASGTKELYVRLDSADIDQLFEQIGKAAEKEIALRAFLEKSEIPHLDAFDGME